jgi:hypothetical protein
VTIVFLLHSLTLCAVATTALALADTGAAHLDVRPRVLENGGEATLPIERDGGASPPTLLRRCSCCAVAAE